MTPTPGSGGRPSGGQPPGARAFAEHYAQVAPTLHAWAVLRCQGPLGRALTPDDLVQEVCLAALAAMERFDPARGPFRPWLFGVASRVAAESLRRLARGRLTAGDPLPTRIARELPAEVTTVSRRVRQDESLAGFVAEVGRLDEDDQRLLVLRGLEGLEHGDVAALLGLTPEGAAKRWQRLRDRLRAWPAARILLHDD